MLKAAPMGSPRDSSCFPTITIFITIPIIITTTITTTIIILLRYVNSQLEPQLNEYRQLSQTMAQAKEQYKQVLMKHNISNAE